MIRRKYRISRRIGVGIFGDEKDPVKSRAYPPGIHGRKGYPRQTDYGRQLHEKQKVRFMYNITEKALGNIFSKASSSSGNTITNMLELLESRLDSVLYRGKLAPTIHSAAQLISHKHVRVNGMVVNIRSCRLCKGDVVTINSSSKDMELVLSGLQNDRNIPDYLSLDENKKEIKVLSMPVSPSDVPYPVNIDFNLVLSYYSA